MLRLFFVNIFICLVFGARGVYAEIFDPDNYYSSYEISSRAYKNLSAKELKAALTLSIGKDSEQYLIQRTLWETHSEVNRFCEEMVVPADYEGMQQCHEIKLRKDASYFADAKEFYELAKEKGKYVAATKMGIALMVFHSFRGDFLTFEKYHKALLKEIPVDAELSHLNISTAAGISYALSNSPPVIRRGIRLLREVESNYEKHIDQFSQDPLYMRLKYNLGVFYFKIKEFEEAERYFRESYGHPRLGNDARILHAITLFTLDNNTPGLVTLLKDIEFGSYVYNARVTFLECLRNYIFFKKRYQNDLSFCYRLGTKVQIDAVLIITDLLAEDEDIPKNVRDRINDQFRKFYNANLSKIISDNVNRTIDFVELQRIESENQRKKLALANSQLLIEEQNNVRKIIVLASLSLMMMLVLLWWKHKESLRLKLFKEKASLAHKTLELNKIFGFIKSLDQAIVVVSDKTGAVTHEGILNAENLRSILGDPVPDDDTNIYDLIFTKTSIGLEKMEEIKNLLAGMLGEDELNFSINRYLLPEHCMLGKKHLHIDYNPVLDDDNIVDKMVLSISDISQSVALEKQLDDNRKETSKILDMLEYGLVSSEQLFQNFMLQFKAETIPESIAVSKELGPIKNMLHNWKGNFRSAGFEEIAHDIHHIEDCIQSGDSLVISELCSHLEALIKEYQHILDQKLDFHTDAGFDSQRLQQLEQKLYSPQDNIEDIKDELFDVFVGSLFIDWSQFASQLKSIHRKISENESLDMQLELIVDSEDAFFLRKDVLESLKTAFTHFFNNSVAHGYIDGKRLSISVDCLMRDAIRFVYRDNGRGLNLKKLASLQSKEFSDEALAQTIFDSGVSTADGVSLLAGRGVGMSAVAEMVKALSGDLRVEFIGPKRDDGFRAFSLVLEIPSRWSAAFKTAS
ncbi:MAG: hypothetical protein HRU19_22395 [Pseudobacteriovorax sp.]|nr:hypothetical protein [Pseudobacteriovorax sp.]